MLDVEAEEGRPRIVELRCRDCGYGAACRGMPERCPICGGADWAETKIERAGPGDSSFAVLDLALDEDASIVAPGHERSDARVIDKTERYVLVAG